jgi:hypothetical protein
MHPAEDNLVRYSDSKSATDRSTCYLHAPFALLAATVATRCSEELNRHPSLRTIDPELARAAEAVSQSK